MKRTVHCKELLFTGLIIILGLVFTSPHSARGESFEEIARDAYIYAYPLVLMDITMRQMTNVPYAGNIVGRAPVNQFFHAKVFPPVEFKTVVSACFDTLYSSAWLDLNDEPVILSVPDTNGRYYLMEMLDMWSDVFDTPGFRTTGTGTGDNMGTYGTSYLRRAVVALMGLGANLPEDAIYPRAVKDSQGYPLNGSNQYVLHFDGDQLPPVEAFWSLTMYDMDGFAVKNDLNRYVITDADSKYNDDGSLDIYIGNGSPGEGLESNWLPAPDGFFALIMRLYAPGPEALRGQWVPPALIPYSY